MKSHVNIINIHVDTIYLAYRRIRMKTYLFSSPELKKVNILVYNTVMYMHMYINPKIVIIID